MSHIQRYLQQLSSNLDCNTRVKEELIEEFRDHLLLLKKEYIIKGMPEDISEKCAVFDFGDCKLLQKNLNQTLSPFRGIIKIVQWLFFVTYIWFASMALFIGKFDNLSYLNNADRGVTLRFDWGIYSDYNVIPFKNIEREIVQSVFWVAHRNAFDISFFKTALGVVLLFILFSFFLQTLFKVNTLKKIIIYSVVTGISIELVQYITNTGALNVNDILFYVVGSVFGWLIYTSIRKVNVPRLGKIKA